MYASACVQPLQRGNGAKTNIHLQIGSGIFTTLQLQRFLIFHEVAMVEWFSVRVYKVLVAIIWTVVVVSTIAVLLVACLPKVLPQSNDAMFFGGVAVIVSQVLIDMFINIVSMIMVMRIRLARITALKSQITSGMVASLPRSAMTTGTNPKFPIAFAVSHTSSATKSSHSKANSAALILSSRDTSKGGSEEGSVKAATMSTLSHETGSSAVTKVVLADPAVKWASFILSSLSLTLLTIVVFMAICILLQSDLAVAIAEIFGRFHYAFGLIFLYCLGYVLHPEEAPFQNPWVLFNPLWLFSIKKEQHGGVEKRNVEAPEVKEREGGGVVSELKVHLPDSAPRISVAHDQWKITNVWEAQTQSASVVSAGVDGSTDLVVPGAK
ncbi:hypothetical protein HK102_006995 [Quaeritorhiza haematococci]|nr:hypothetical protein HK102_006995 [Quaeritorhiza haematococci]